MNVWSSVFARFFASSRSRLRLAVGVVLLGSLAGHFLFIPAVVSEKSVATRPPLAVSDFIGSQSCAECHAEIAARYATHPMSHSIGPLQSASVLEDYSEHTSFASSATRRYRVERRGDEVWHHEEGVGRDGDSLYDQSVQMKWAIGSGHHGRAYLQQRGDRLYQSPIGWYAGSSDWGLSPGYAPDDPIRFDRAVGERCLNCHAGRINTGPAPRTFDEHAPIAEHAIGCERCHGPGRAHRDFHLGKSVADSKDDLINLAKLDPVRRDAICHQCHLQGPLVLPRAGVAETAFRPGDRLSDVWVMLLDSDRPERQGVSHSAQMLESVCYQRSEGRLGCISCHDPHASSPRGLERAAYFSERCAKCHGANDPECSLTISARKDQSCVDCHMPRFSTSNLPHTALTDHRILRRIGTASTRPQHTIHHADVFEEGGGSPLPREEVQRAWVIAAANGLVSESDPIFQTLTHELTELLKRWPQDLELQAAQVQWALRQREWELVLKFSGLLLEQAPHRRDAQEAHAAALHGLGQFSEAAVEYRKMIEADPECAAYHQALAQCLWGLRDVEGTLTAAERALELNPTLGPLRGATAAAYTQRGDRIRAQQHTKFLEQLSRPR